MARYRRHTRRQGVFYGPPRDVEPGAGAGLLGRVLGAAVVVGAFGVLAAGTYAFLGRAPEIAVTPSPTAVAVSPTPTPSPSPTPAPSPTPTLVTTLPPSPSASPFAIEVREGPGAITFGTQFNPNTLRILDPHTSFPPTGRFVWSAQLTEAAGAPELTAALLSYDPASGLETPVSESTVEVNNQRASVFLRRVQMQHFVPGPGIYVLRYLRGDILLAEGLFEVTAE